VIGGVAGNGLGIARNLGQLDIDVYCVTSHRYELICLSNYCKGYTVLPGVDVDPMRLQTFLKWFTSQFEGKGVLFPTSDQSLLTIAQINTSLKRYVTPIPEPSLVDTMVRKAKFYKSLRAARVPHPLTLYPEEEPVSEMMRKLVFPVYIWPDVFQVFVERF
jgi:predicted ATP-grasp superfamily ATP-dependent carboligase